MARLPHIARKHKKSRIMGKPAVITQQDIASLAGVRHNRKADQDVVTWHFISPKVLHTDQSA